MDLTTTYMGYTLANPIVVGASPLSWDLDKARRCADAGAGALVMYSLFEEQIVREQLAINRALYDSAEGFPEAITYLPEPEELNLGPDRYLEQIRKLKRNLPIPIIASLNGTTEGGWVKYARLIEQAGADGLELNTYNLVTEPRMSGADVEAHTVQLVREIRKSIRIPLAVKLSPFYTALPNFAERLSSAGADTLVLFNRFYQPDIDTDNLEVIRVNLSDSAELLMRLHWMAILFGHVDAELAVTGGVHTHKDLIKCVMAGASAVQMVSALLKHGPTHVRSVLVDLRQWLGEREYESVDQLLGTMSLIKCPDPAQYVRDNYMQVLHSWKE